MTDPLCIDHWVRFVTTPVVNKDVAEIRIESAVANHSGQEKTVTLRSIILDSRGQLVKTVDSEQTIPAGATQVVTQMTGFLNPALWVAVIAVTLYTGKQIDDRPQGGRQQHNPIRCPFVSIRSGQRLFPERREHEAQGMCLHHDAGPLGAAVPEKVWRRRLEAMKEIGCNAIRCSHNPPSPEFLDLCDEMGFLVQDEAFDEFTPPKNKWVEGWNKGKPSKDGYGDVFEEWAVRDIQDMIRRDRNHPSIIMWSIGNEVDYRNDPFSHPSLGDEYRPGNPKAENLTKYGRMLVQAVKELDTTRPVTAALATATMSNAVGFSDVLDIVGYNYQEPLYEAHHAQYPSRVLYGSENSTNYQAWKAVEDNDYISGQFVWTGIDYLGEAGAWPYKSWTRSLFDLCCFKKPSAWFRQSIWTDEPMVYITCNRRSEGRRWSNPRPHLELAGRRSNQCCLLQQL